MSTFEERQRARVNNLISEMMDDVASEVRKAVTPKTDSPATVSLPTGAANGGNMRLAGRDDMFGSQVWLNFDEAAFEQWFRKWFDRQVRMHGGMKPLLNRLR